MKFKVFVNEDKKVFITKEEMRDYYFDLMNDCYYKDQVKEYVLEVLDDYYSIEGFCEMIFNNNIDAMENFKKYCLKVSKEYYEDEYLNRIAREVEEKEIEIPDEIIREKLKES